MSALLRRPLPVLLAVLAACASASRSTPSAAPAPSGPGAADLQALERIARARQDSLRHRYVQADVDFMLGMMGHHAQAIVMSRMAATHGAGTSVQTLAGRIINAQSDEIGLMRQWLADRGLAAPDSSELLMHATMGHGAHGMAMPGMLTPDQLAELDAARGAEFDRRFLTYMIQHHKGATSMVRTLFGTYGAGQDEQVFKFANDVNVDQTTEIARMELMLGALKPAAGTQ